MIWTDEKVAQLKRLAALGKTFSEVATAIGGGCTRCMVAGKAKRLGVSFPVSTEKLSRAQRGFIARIGPEAWAERMETARRDARARRAVT